MRAPLGARGFTLLELMVSIAVAGLLLSLAVPGLTTWVNNGKIRGVADQMQNAIRLAQNESLRRSHQVVFVLTNNPAPTLGAFSANTSGPYWVVQTIPFMENEVAEIVESGALIGSNNRVAISANTAQLCFNSVGRLTNNSATGVSGASNCSAAAATYNISLTGAGSDTPLRINVGLNGQVHMCNPNKAFDAVNAPDGCP